MQIVLLSILNTPHFYLQYIGILSISINVQLNPGLCEGFTDSDGEYRRMSIVLAPINTRVEDGLYLKLDLQSSRAML